MEYNDFELIYMAKEKNEEAIKYLYDKYKPLLEKKAREYYSVSKNKGVDFSDYLQEAMIGFEEAIISFDNNSNTLFYTFVNICVDRQLKTAFAKLNRAKHKILNEAVSLDYMYDEDYSIGDFVKEDKGNPEELLIEIDEESMLYNKIIDKLNVREKEVFDLKVKGYDYIEIANILKKDTKAITNILYRIRLKVKDIINNDK